MANNQQTKNWGNSSISSKFRSFQNSVKTTMNDFTGIDKSTRSYRSATVSTMNHGGSGMGQMGNNTKSASGARQYQSGRRRSIDRTPSHSGHSSHGSLMGIDINNMITGHGHGHSRGSSITSHPPQKYQKRRKRSLLIGRNSYQFNENSSPSTGDRGSSPTNNSQSNQSGLGPKLPPNFYPPESFVNYLYRITELDQASGRNRFGLAILDIDNLRGHIQSPLQKQNPNRMSRTMQSPSRSSKVNKKLVKPSKTQPQRLASNQNNNINARNNNNNNNNNNPKSK